MTKGVDLDWFSNDVLLQFILIYKMMTGEHSSSMKTQYWAVLLIFVCPLCILDRFNLVLKLKPTKIAQQNLDHISKFKKGAEAYVKYILHSD